MFNLAKYYQYVEKKYELMEKYYLLAIQKNNKGAMNQLKKFYENNEPKFYLLLNNIENKNKLITDELILLRNKHYKLQIYHTKLSLAMDKFKFIEDCMICYNNEYQIIFNCGHYCCKNCCFEIEKCHLCKIRIW
jgi:TPR repeat protein